jgi:hypothetical protein
MMDGPDRQSALSELWKSAYVPGYTRWAYLAPALVGFLFVGHAWEDAGWQGASPYALVLLVSTLQLIRPTVVGWLITATLLLVYLILFIVEAPMDPVAQWVVFLLVGLVPALLLIWARPRVRNISREAAASTTCGGGHDAG